MDEQLCSQCGTSNDSGYKFCQNCGAKLSLGPLVKSGPVHPPTARQPGVDESRPPATVPRQPMAPARRSPGQIRQARSDRPIGQMGRGGVFVADIWGPFAGYGERGRHVSWLLDNLGSRAQELRRAVTLRFKERQIPNARIERRTLTGRGILVERRPYYLIRRGITTAGLYIAQFGQDLYISQVTYAKGPINPLRVLIFVLMILFQLYMAFGYSSSIESLIGNFDILSGYSGSLDQIGMLICCVGPLGLVNMVALILAGLHMIYKFLTEKDPLALLRTPLNEFQLDDTVALEKAVEETVRQSMDMVGIDSGLMPPAAEYGFKRRLI